MHVAFYLLIAFAVLGIAMMFGSYINDQKSDHIEDYGNLFWFVIGMMILGVDAICWLLYWAAGFLNGG